MKSEITKNNIKMEIKRAEALSSWSKLTNEGKIDSFLIRSNEEILDWHCLQFGEKRKVSISWEQWRDKANDEYSNKTSLFDLYVRKQGEDETISAFIKEVVKISTELGVEEVDRRKIIKNGIQPKFKLVKLFLSCP